jgi:ribonuclease HI
MTDLKTLQDAHLTIFTDGGSRGNPGNAAIGVVIKSGAETVSTINKYLGIKTNNEAEYEAFAASLAWVLATFQPGQVKQIDWKLDSMLVVEQLNKKWKIKEPRMAQFAQNIWATLANAAFTYTISYVPRAENADADLLVNQALDAVIITP